MNNAPPPLAPLSDDDLDELGDLLVDRSPFDVDGLFSLLLPWPSPGARTAADMASGRPSRRHRERRRKRSPAAHGAHSPPLQPGHRSARGAKDAHDRASGVARALRPPNSRRRSTSCPPRAPVVLVMAQCFSGDVVGFFAAAPERPASGSPARTACGARTAPTSAVWSRTACARRIFPGSSAWPGASCSRASFSGSATNKVRCGASAPSSREIRSARCAARRDARSQEVRRRALVDLLWRQ